MASLLREPLFEISGQGPPPNKDFYHLAVTRSDVIWRYWRISLRNECRNAKPGEQIQPHGDYLDDSRLHSSQVRLVFGPGVLTYTRGLCQGHYDYLERLPDPLLLRVLAYLELEEVGKLGQTSQRFRKTVPAEARPLAAEVGWRRLFFTSKLQLQKLISRRRRRQQQQQQQQQHRAEEQQQEEEEEEEEEEEGEGLIPQASGTPEAFWDGAGSSGANPSPAGTTTTVTEYSFDTESYSDSDSLSDPMPHESGSEGRVASVVVVSVVGAMVAEGQEQIHYDSALAVQGYP
ncbi:hypothetical protein CRUP_033350 [Coryphaenoides rupestris]|nr:hypothetical protein CRUP_033350 [Coryphaenoides rupestris]